MRKASVEHRLQMGVAEYLRAALPPEVWWSSIDMANAKDALTGAIRKARGAVAGIPDVLLCHAGKLIGIEIKTETGRLSPAQIVQHQRMRVAGAAIYVVRNSYDVEAVLREEGIPVRARHLALGIMRETAAAGPTTKKGATAGTRRAPMERRSK